MDGVGQRWWENQLRQAHRPVRLPENRLVACRSHPPPHRPSSPRLPLPQCLFCPQSHSARFREQWRVVVLDLGAPNGAFSSAQISEHKESTGPSYINDDDGDAGGVQVTCCSEVVNETIFHLQIIRLPKQIYAWIGCNSAKFGHLYAVAPMRSNSTVGVTSILGGASDNTGSGIARRLVLKTGLNIILACNIPKSSPMLEADAEKLLVQKLINLGYTRPPKDSRLSRGFWILLDTRNVY